MKLLLPSKIPLMLSADEALFAQMVFILGYSATTAYQKAINPRISRASAQVKGSLLLSEDKVQRAGTILLRYYEAQLLDFNDRRIKIFNT